MSAGPPPPAASAPAPPQASADQQGRPSPPPVATPAGRDAATQTGRLPVPPAPKPAEASTDSMPRTSAATQALIRECKAVGRMRARGELPVGIDVAPKGDDLFDWAACIRGPAGTPYEGGTWNLDIQFPSDYPMVPPKIRFITPIYHPNVNPDGRICLDVTGGYTGRDFREAWSAALTIDKVLLQIMVMMGTPNFDDPWVPMTPEEWKRKAPVETKEKAMGTSLVPAKDETAEAERTSPVAQFDYDGFGEDDDGQDDEEYEESGDSSDGAEAPVAPSTSAGGKDSTAQYADELAQLESLGVQANRETMLEVLRRCHGNVGDAFSRLCD
eukprot:TRINITY_DN46942_c0_g1_i1.p1 TRINITY_DN46942_c0_g1~~TRINITY_DN46942_c0_g1_i1.p1  ORF type:complete len:355 (+),score=48.85 TRINITY_DN46942_c0_g1_i1:83-1066(+)